MLNTSNVKLRPNRVTITPKRQPQTMDRLLHTMVNRANNIRTVEQYTKNFQAVKNSFIVSKASKRKIIDSINNIYALSTPRTIVMKNGKKIYNFRASFVTLTLPSKQRHTDVYIKKHLLNQFLIELKQSYGVENWLWKAELQKNENIHFHLILDKYVDYQAIRRRWNRICNKLEYVDNYSKRMTSMSLSDYHKQRSHYKKTTFKASAEAYAMGSKHKWMNPNSVDVRSVKCSNDLGAYLAKYITKRIEFDPDDKEGLKRGLAFGRSWSRSYSLVSLDNVNNIDPMEWVDLLKYLNSKVKTVLHLVGDYFQAFYYNIDTFPEDLRTELLDFFKDSAIFLGYRLPYG